MSARKELGKIQSVRYGHGGYQDAMLGISFALGGSGWGVGDFWGYWAPSLIDCGEHCKWTEADRDADMAKTARRIDALLKDAKVNDVAKLAGIPIEVTFNGMTLESWRVLGEVL
jgi:hypothetical protein